MYEETITSNNEKVKIKTAKISYIVKVSRHGATLRTTYYDRLPTDKEHKALIKSIQQQRSEKRPPRAWLPAWLPPKEQTARKAHHNNVQNAIVLVDKVSDKVMSGIEGAHKVKVNRQNDKEDVTTLINIDYSNVKGAERLDTVDPLTANAVYSALDAGNNFISFDRLNRIKHGGRDVKLTPKTREKIIKDLKIMMTTFITIDNENEAIAYNRTHIKRMETTAIKGTFIEAEVRGKLADGVLIQECILFDYAKACGQLERYPLKVLDTPLNSSPKNDKLKYYLLRRIARIKGKAGHTNIRLDTIYKNILGIEGKPTRSQQVQISNLKKSIEEVLKQWKTQGLYKNYLITKESITITPKRKKN